MASEKVDLAPAFVNKPWAWPTWLQPLIIIIILATSLFLTRRRGYEVVSQTEHTQYLLREDVDVESEFDDMLIKEQMLRPARNDRAIDSTSEEPKIPPKTRQCCGIAIRTPNTTRYRGRYQSRLMQRFPFLIEIFYMVLTLLVHGFMASRKRLLFSKTDIWSIGDSHAIRILEVEQFSWASFMFYHTEFEVQWWMIHKYPNVMKLLSATYAMLSIPLMLCFTIYHHCTSPSPTSYPTFRRTLLLMPLLASLISTLYPVTPPRYLPPSYEFVDLISHTPYQALFLPSSSLTPQAIPSIHLCFSLLISVVLLQQSSPYPLLHSASFQPITLAKIVCKVLVAVLWPLWILLSLIATGNGFLIDVLVSGLVCGVAYAVNRILLLLLPLEDMVLWCLRLEKPGTDVAMRIL